jgi:two-component sensor histidine kinase
MSELKIADKVVPFAPVQSRSAYAWGDQLLDALPIGVYICDRDGVLVRYNERAAELWGRAPALGDPQQRYCGALRAYRTDGQAIPPEEVPMVEVLRTGKPVADREIVIERPDGSRLVALANIQPLLSESGEMMGAVNCFQDITDRKASEESLRLLAGEVDHRAKNMLAIIQAVVHLTQADSISDLKLAIEGRISALSRAHTLLSSSRWEGADIRRIVQEELASCRGGPEADVSVDGPSLPLSAQLAQSLAMVIHELASNAERHGAIARGGKIDLSWSGAPRDRLLLRWTESGCARISPPARNGFGLTIIEGAIRQQLGGTVELDWREDGLRCAIEVSLG